MADEKDENDEDENEDRLLVPLPHLLLARRQIGVLLADREPDSRSRGDDRDRVFGFRRRKQFGLGFGLDLTTMGGGRAGRDLSHLQ